MGRLFTRKGDTMITKFEKIDDFAVFKNFDWNTDVVSPEGTPLALGEINVIYGRNYSGKTTLSRILRSVETGKLPSKIDDPKFILQCDDGSVVNETNYKTCGIPVRVFNDDFIRDNLRFLIDPDGEIQSFAVLGDTNKTTTEEIERLKKDIGVDDKDNPTGLWKAYRDAENLTSNAFANKEKAHRELDEKLSNKAVGRKIGIKYQPGLYGDQNYNITKLQKDINAVSVDGYKPISAKERDRLIKLTGEEQKDPIADVCIPSLHFSGYYSSAKELLKQEIGGSNKIQELLSDIALDNWVKRGVELHKDSRKRCAFCGGVISDSRWTELFKHYDEASQKLKEDITGLLEKIEAEKSAFLSSPTIDKTQLYSEYHDDIDLLLIEFNNIAAPYLNCLDTLKDALSNRLKQITQVSDLPEIIIDTVGLSQWYRALAKIVSDSNAYTSSLGRKKHEAQTTLRLDSVYQFCNEINYCQIKKRNDKLDDALKEQRAIQEADKASLDTTIAKLEAQKRFLNDEEEGAKQVDKYLNHCFGHKYLSLQAVELDETEGKQIKFKIMRGEEPAFNLSEGECSLIAFCYFIAKLDDVNTKGKKPIVWIDDPISSLDANHIYFVFSLIQAKLCKELVFSQLFVSTHNLEFLKYLKRLKAFKRSQEKDKDVNVRRMSLMTERVGENSRILPMPKYLKENATEFNYLFSIIYKCAQVVSVTDENHAMLHDFGNNARKFLEIYLYFYYPDTTEDLYPKMKRFFEPDVIPAVLVDRMDNENSHGTSLEKATGYDISPEAIDAAKCILKQLQAKNEEQYNSLLSSIGAKVTVKN